MNTFSVKCYCCFYKYIWLIPLTDKKGKTIFKVFQKILDESGRKSNNTWVGKIKIVFRR